MTTSFRYICAAIASLSVFSLPAITFADVRAMSLDELVYESSLIAKVKIVQTEKTKHSGYMKIAHVLIQDAIVGCATADIIKLRFDNGEACPNVTYVKDEEFLLYAVQDIDGTYSTVGYSNGKCLIKPADYSERVAKIKKLSLKNKAVLLLEKTSSEKETLLITIKNKGENPLSLNKNLFIDVRHERYIYPKTIITDRNVVTLTLLLPDSNLHPTLDTPSESNKPTTLQKNESCTGTIATKDIPVYINKSVKATAWVSFGPYLSNPIEINIKSEDSLEEDIEECPEIQWKKVQEQKKEAIQQKNAPDQE